MAREKMFDRVSVNVVLCVRARKEILLKLETFEGRTEPAIFVQKRSDKLVFPPQRRSSEISNKILIFFCNLYDYESLMFTITCVHLGLKSVNNFKRLNSKRCSFVLTKSITTL